MGTWGAFLACRTPADPRSVWPEAEIWGEPVGGWALVVTGLEERSGLAEALAALPGPALAAEIYDSDYAYVAGAVDGNVRWEVLLDEATAAEDGVAVPETPAADDPALHERIAEWAAGYGTAVARAELRRVLAAEHVFVDDTLHELARVLGILDPAAAPPQGGDKVGPEIEIRFPADVWVERQDAVAEPLDALAGELDAEVYEHPAEPDGQTLALLTTGPLVPDEVLRRVAAHLRDLGLPPTVRIRPDDAAPWRSIADC
ncbi:hypothetical protein DPM19_09205 [Actinomadura craniellae]|uniref:Uncharacterized protein n=1 Tax=Actinomadura craniellae TaxID=2231787 RepID=A0A365HA10_9ACTN|nr:hypothetical protein [Actinomadura craniellae]RAY15921.1 hypothetical protein DPM19_09205 [Actinomadura craniellae]